MINEKTIRSVFFTMLFLSLMIWSGIGYITDKYESNILTIGRYLSSAILALFTLNWKYAVYAFGFPIIKGKYKGISKEVKADSSIEVQLEEVTIKQSLLSTTVSAVSKTANEEFYSIWRGSLIEYSDQYFKFIIEIETREQIYYGVLSLRFEDEKCTGFCTYLEPNKASTKDSVELERVKPEGWREILKDMIW